MKNPFWSKRKKTRDDAEESNPALAVQTCSSSGFGLFSHQESYLPQSSGELRLYRALREGVPIIDAAISKLLRLIGDFQIKCSDAAAERALEDFLREVPVNYGEHGIQSFLTAYFSQLLTYGNAVGEVVLNGAGKIGALYNAALDDVEFKAVSPLKMQICRREQGQSVPVAYPELVLTTALNPEPGSLKGTSLLHGLPFVSSILLQIYQTIGLNWERAGNVRFAVTYRPSGDGDRAMAKERARQIAAEWSKTMTRGSISDFVTVGDVNIRAIGADNQILDSDIPVRQLLEQIVAKLGLPPFLLGLSWSSTERMSSQQADILTSELEAYRRLLNPVLEQICSIWLRLNGFTTKFYVDWENITMQDETESANARLLNARAAEIEERLKGR